MPREDYKGRQMSIYTIWKILKPNGGLPECRSTGRTVESLPKARDEGERLMQEKGWHGVGIRLAGSPHSGAWSYLNCSDYGLDDPRVAKMRRLPKYSKPALPMEGNPIKDS